MTIQYLFSAGRGLILTARGKRFFCSVLYITMIVVKIIPKGQILY
ncbi:hypothetical protein DCCM_4249 [Desulfocucumis palustris]|uniref:Uncharacterized protein n=1 Tax=Desulfocucumis palustris TaxID=1898651 RepID=A0A2L2XLF7_9FIRM|nr:hypothetical protein DCCM_4249 [Desulfocucumis palustris]